MSTTVAVAGASGYAGGELLRLLSTHREFEVTTVTAHANAGQRLGDVHPHLRRYADLVLADTTADALLGHDVVFLALPHGASGALTGPLSDSPLVIDCGADHRLTDEAEWDRYYGGAYTAAWTYGLPELLLADPTTPTAESAPARQRDALTTATRIAVPGCNVTAITLGLAPAVAAGLAEPQDLVAVLAVGTSGAGKAAKTELLASELLGSANAYQVGGAHRHTPEILQNLAAAGGVDPSISFTPVLVPMSRGILATATARIRPGTTTTAVRAAYEAAYDDEPFVHLMPEGRFPRTADAVGANTALIGLAIDERAGRLVTVTAIDNLVKGTAGAAVQCANLASGLAETLGLPLEGVAP